MKHDENIELLIKKLSFRLKFYTMNNENNFKSIKEFLRISYKQIDNTDELTNDDYYSVTKRALLKTVREELNSSCCKIDEEAMLRILISRIPSGKLDMSDLKQICKRTIDIYKKTFDLQKNNY